MVSKKKRSGVLMGNKNSTMIMLLALENYEPESYELEINEIFDCILEDRKYDESPRLDRWDLIDLLESLGHHLFLETKSLDLSSIRELRNVVHSDSKDIQKEEILRKKIKNILSGK